MCIRDRLNGVAQGSQPLLSSCYGRGETENMNRLVRLAMITAVIIGTVIYVCAAFFAPQIAGIFNRDNDAGLTRMAVNEMCIRDRIYTCQGDTGC